MPQMSPMNWLYLYIYFIMVYLIFNFLIYYIKFYLSDKMIENKNLNVIFKNYFKKEFTNKW